MAHCTVKTSRTLNIRLLWPAPAKATAASRCSCFFSRVGTSELMGASLTWRSDASPVLLRPCSVIALLASFYLPPPQAQRAARVRSAAVGRDIERQVQAFARVEKRPAWLSPGGWTPLFVRESKSTPSKLIRHEVNCLPASPWNCPDSDLPLAHAGRRRSRLPMAEVRACLHFPKWLLRPSRETVVGVTDQLRGGGERPLDGTSVTGLTR